MAVLKAPLFPQAAAMPGYQILPGPTAGSAEVDLSTPRGCLLCLGLPRVWGGGADGGTCHTQARAQGGLKSHGDPEDSGLLARSEAQKIGGKHQPATANWQADSVPQPRRAALQQ